MSSFTRAQLFLAAGTLLYIAAFSFYFFRAGNFEFLGYVGVLLFFFILIATTLSKSRFPLSILWGLSIWGFLHMAGGGIAVGDGVLYGQTLVSLFDGGGDFVLLKYDQVVHAFGFGVATLVAYHLLKPQLRIGYRHDVVYVLLIAIGMGLGALNELIEFAAVLVAPETGVGGYHNTLLDLVFNTIGAVFAVFYIHLRDVGKNT